MGLASNGSPAAYPTAVFMISFDLRIECIKTGISPVLRIVSKPWYRAHFYSSTCHVSVVLHRAVIFAQLYPIVNMPCRSCNFHLKWSYFLSLTSVLGRKWNFCSVMKV